MLIVIICMGGIVYNILHATPFAKCDRYGNIVEFIQTGQRSQYAGEGVLMSTLFVAGGTMLYSFNWLNSVRGYGQHKIASFTVIIFTVLVVRIIFSIYRIKPRVYNQIFFPLGHYVQSPLILDQGNSF